MYHHTQTGTVTRLAALGGLLAAVAVLVWEDSRPVLWVMIAVAALGAWTFGSLTVEVDQARLAFWFGPGWIRRSFPLADIRSWAVVENPWWYGWGIHLTRHGWLYNVAGKRAIQLELHDGRRLRIGSDEPDRLAEAIRLLKGGQRPAPG